MTRAELSAGDGLREGSAVRLQVSPLRDGYDGRSQRGRRVHANAGSDAARNAEAICLAGGSCYPRCPAGSRCRRPLEIACSCDARTDSSHETGAGYVPLANNRGGTLRMTTTDAGLATEAAVGYARASTDRVTAGNAIEFAYR